MKCEQNTLVPFFPLTVGSKVDFSCFENVERCAETRNLYERNFRTLIDVLRVTVKIVALSSNIALQDTSKNVNTVAAFLVQFALI